MNYKYIIFDIFIVTIINILFYILGFGDRNGSDLPSWLIMANGCFLLMLLAIKIRKYIFCNEKIKSLLLFYLLFLRGLFILVL
jgi:hypothetical protein